MKLDVGRKPLVMQALMFPDLVKPTRRMVLTNLGTYLGEQRSEPTIIYSLGF